RSRALDHRIAAAVLLEALDCLQIFLLRAAQVLRRPEGVPERNIGEMDADDRPAMAAGELIAHRAPPIAAMGAIAFIAQDAGHQLVPEIAEAEQPALLRPRLR